MKNPKGDKSISFEKWWNNQYTHKIGFKINYRKKLKLGFMKSTENNLVYTKCLLSGVDDSKSLRKTGGRYDFGSTATRGYHFSFWLLYDDESLIERLTSILEKMNFSGITSISKKRVHAFFNDDNPDHMVGWNLLMKFSNFLEDSGTYFTAERM